MKRSFLVPFLLLVALAGGCKPAPQKMGVALPTAPPIFQVIPAGTNPNTLGIPGAQGTVLQNSGGVGSWVMGTGGVWVSNPPTGGGTPDGGYTLASLAAQAPATVVGVAVDAGTVPPSALTATQFTALLNPATSSLQGAMTAALAANLSGGVAAFVSPTIDLVAGGSFTFPNTTRPGFLFLPLLARWQNLTVGGTISVGPTTKIGNDGSHVNMQASAVFPAITTAASGVPGIGATSFMQSSTTSALDLAAPIIFVVSSGATGSSPIWTGRYAILGVIVPTS